MKLALLSDVHANLQALQACLAHARRAGAARFAFLGDLVGYGADPLAVVRTVMDLCAAGGTAVRGNHDEAAGLAPSGGPARDAEALAAGWTRAQLGPQERSFLAGLPLLAQVEGSLLVHASAEAPADWRYVNRPEQAQQCLDAATARGLRRVFCGHVHEQRLYYMGRVGKLMAFDPVEGAPVPLGLHREWLGLVGSVGQPRDGDPRAMYALLDVTQDRLVFHRVAYDHLGAAAAIRQAGLPGQFASRLEAGR